MLRIRRIEISNFVCFDSVAVEPSTDPERPLTVVRAENGSGKTTFLRAVRWGMYGERGLPGEPSRYSLHPASWTPDPGGIETQVVIEFETDGSTRHDQATSNSTTLYRLVRSVRTIDKPAARDDEPDYRRVNEQTQLMFKTDDGLWQPHTSGVDAVVEQLLPWDLRDFFVMDADEVADFVGGGENKVISRKEVERKTTAAVHSLLGIDVFQKASARVSELGREFGARATKAIGDADLNLLQDDLNVKQDERDRLLQKIGDHRSQMVEHSDHLARAHEELETELKGIGATEGLRSSLKQNTARRDTLEKERKRLLSELARSLESASLLGALASRQITRVHEILKPLYDKGHIPLKHIEYVQDLLDSGVCVCGQDLKHDSEYRNHVLAAIVSSEAEVERANYLANLYDASRSLSTAMTGGKWRDERVSLEGELSGTEEQLRETELERREIELKLDELDEDRIQTVRDEIAARNRLLDTAKRDLALAEARLVPLESDIDSIKKTLFQRHRRERAATDMRAAEAAAELVVDVLDKAYRTIQEDQVVELSQRMNRLFMQMAANVSDEDVTQDDSEKASLRMIAEVGIRPLDQDRDSYEIFALNGRGRPMPPHEINGASRRVLALSFVLALSIESGTEAPLIADSLLNFMSGTVRTNTLAVTADNSRQPILLLTSSDLESAAEAATVERFGGASYSLTGQWDAIDASEGGDVIHWTRQLPVSLLCECGPREYCSICERSGVAEKTGWTRRREVKQ